MLCQLGNISGASCLKSVSSFLNTFERYQQAEMYEEQTKILREP